MWLIIDLLDQNHLPEQPYSYTIPGAWSGPIQRAQQTGGAMGRAIELSPGTTTAG
jgi:hypothetical protein